MHIFLVILKIIGITVLILLGIAVTLSLLILFVPVRYHVTVNFDNDARLNIHLKWLARILQCRIVYPKGELWIIRLFGIPIMRSGRNKRKKKRSRKKKSGGYEKPATERGNHIIGNAENNDSLKAEVDSGKYDTNYHNADEDGAKCGADNVYVYDDISGGTKRSRKRNRKGKQKKKRASLKSWFGMIRDERNKRIIVFLKDIVIKFLKRVRPKKIRADMVIGFEDPAYTGLFFGGLGILTVCWEGKYNITPDFEKKILKGRVCAKGYVRFADMLYFLLKILLNEDIKRVMKKGQVN